MFRYSSCYFLLEKKFGQKEITKDEYLTDIFWSGVKEGIMATPFSRAERWRGADRKFWSGVKNEVSSKKIGAYQSLLTSKSGISSGTLSFHSASQLQ